MRPTPASPQPATVRWRTTNRSALAPQDLVASSGVATIPAGRTAATITVPVVGDTVVEPDETLRVPLSLPTNAGIADGCPARTIRDND